jgi:uncharacterized protein (TIGR01777 family)
MKKVLITGGSGLIGTHLARMLKAKGYVVSLLSRRPKTDSNTPVFFWDPEKGEIDPKALDQVDYIIHLAGINIGERRWTPGRKKQIVDSRVKSGDLVLHTLKAQGLKPKAFISASGIGYYGAVTTTTLFEENAPAALDFLGFTCKEWEAVADRFEENGIRSVKIRTGVVLAKKGGALSKLSLPVRLGVGAPLGSGKQYMPWIHMKDLCEIFIYAMEHNELNGAYNAAAPQHRTNREFTREIAKVLKRPLWLPRVPAVFLRLIFGEMSKILLEGSRVSSEKIRQAGYAFQFPELEPALKDLLAPGK